MVSVSLAAAEPDALGIVSDLAPALREAVSFYGPKVGEVDGHDYDASRDYVCDRADA